MILALALACAPPDADVVCAPVGMWPADGCPDGVVATDEGCDAVDNDCDGLIDEEVCAAGRTVSEAELVAVGAGTTAYETFGSALAIDVDGTLAVASAAFLGEAPGRVGVYDASGTESLRATLETGDAKVGAVAWPGDVDGDGFSDLLVGGPVAAASGYREGAVWLVSGPFVGAVDVPTVAAASILGDASSQAVGSTFVAAGDPDGDGVPDVLVGSPFFGAAWLVPLRLGEGIPVSAGATLTGEQEGDEAGAAVAAAGDVDGDGLDDVLVGAPDADEGAGRVYLLRGPVPSMGLADADAVSAGHAAGDRFGTSVAGGDLDGDGRDDVILGAPGFRRAEGGRGAVLVHTAMLAGAAEAEAAATFFGAEWWSEAGAAVEAADLDGDGRIDLAATGRDAGGEGVWAALGPFAGTIALAGSAVRIDVAGLDHVAAGDLDGDGAADLVLGAPERDDAASAAGAVFAWGAP